jgi:tetratricopeptide (TPR) repeat protein
VNKPCKNSFNNKMNVLHGLFLITKMNKYIKMKHLIFLFLFLCNIGIQAQNSNLVAAWNYLNYKEIDKAKLAIDEASVYEKTAALAKTWYYKGLIYEAINKNSNPAFAKLDSNALFNAFTYYEKSLMIDPKGEFSEDIHRAKTNMYSQFINKGVGEFNSGNYKNATLSFETAMKLNTKDSLALINAANSAYKANDFVKAKKYYEELHRLKYEHPMVYTFLSETYLSEKDTVKALDMIQKGRKSFPKNLNLIFNEVSIFQAQGKNNAVIELFNEAINIDPKDPNVFYSQGLAYEKVGNPAKAEEAYKKAIALKPDFYNPIYSLGAMHFNKAVDLANVATHIRPEKETEYKAAMEKANAQFSVALPYMEKAYQIDSKDEGTLISLKILYDRLDNKEKFQKVSKELDQLKK